MEGSMNPDSQTPADEPQEGAMPQEPTTGVNETPTVPPTGGDEGGDETPEVPEAPETPEAPAPAEGDKEDGAKW